MDRLQGLCTSVFRPIIHGLTQLGLAWRPLLESCGIDPELISDTEARIPADLFYGFWPKAAELSGDPCIGLHVGARLRPAAVNIAGYLLMSSPIVREGLERVTRYQKLVLGAEWIALIDRGSSSVLRSDTGDAGQIDVSVSEEYRATIVLQFLDWVTAADFHASEVRFRHQPAGPRAEYEQILRCPVKFECTETEIWVPRESLNQPSVHANPEIARLHEEYAERHLAALEDRGITRKVKTILLAHLDRSPCELPMVARALHMSPRTLQRRLAEEGVSYSDVLDSLRRDLCLQHLETSEQCLAEIAHIAGFSDASAFNRAMRRWTGQTPQEYRRERSDEQG